MEYLASTSNHTPLLIPSFITFKEGLIGYHYLKTLNFSPFAHLKGHIIYLLKSFDYPDHAWVLIQAQNLFHSHRQIELKNLYYMLKPNNDTSSDMLDVDTYAPLWIDLEVGIGVQKIIHTLDICSLTIGSIKDLKMYD